ncbi:hypothetical protein [Pigmentiphaga litoralis]|uniref:hypothetical protein n=1 Tax=Pigmentiphaga litoralis TaxID=516702 RepID=UPI0016787A9D|nr:hypothetical protein [Pigmentiphaga litoralis]
MTPPALAEASDGNRHQHPQTKLSTSASGRRSFCGQLAGVPKPAEGGGAPVGAGHPTVQAKKKPWCGHHGFPLSRQAHAFQQLSLLDLLEHLEDALRRANEQALEGLAEATALEGVATCALLFRHVVLQKYIVKTGCQITDCRKKQAANQTNLQAAASD